MRNRQNVRVQIVIKFLLVLLLSTREVRPQQKTAAQDQIGYRSASDAEQKKTLLLKDFKPQAMLHAQTHSVDRGSITSSTCTTM